MMKQLLRLMFVVGLFVLPAGRSLAQGNIEFEGRNYRSSQEAIGA